MKWRRSLRSGALAACAVLGSLTCSLNAYALDVGLDVRNCSNVSEARVRELAELELSTPVVGPHLGERPAVSVSVSCVRSDVLIQVADATTGKTVSRSFVLLNDEPDVRARAVALAAAELVLSSWMELAIASPRNPLDAKGAAANEDRRAATAIVRARAERAAHLDALLALSELGGTFHARPLTFGAGLRLSLVSSEPHLAIDADLSVTRANERTLLGDVRTNTWSVALRPALRFERGRWSGTAGVGLRVGIARISGRASDENLSRARVVAGTWGGPLVHANLGFAFEHLACRAGAEAGFALKTVSGSVDDKERAGVDGAWLLVSLGLGWGA